MQKLIILFTFLFFSFSLLSGQSIEEQIVTAQKQISDLDSQKSILIESLEEMKLSKVRSDMIKVGLPSDNFIKHSAMILEYSEEHEQAKWVMHMILPDIEKGVVFRSNDFRVDPMVVTGTAIQQDYFLTDTLESGKVKYDGFGYDRGHLAPSADFRWSAKALSESYYYSNMSPQLPEFNRELWAELEDHLRSYVIANQVPLYIITAPKLNEALEVIERSTNKVSIPKSYVKFAYDPINKRSIAFQMSNSKLSPPLEQYAITIDEAEENIGLDVFKNIDANENKLELSKWFKELENGDKEPLDQVSLPKGHFNTIVSGKRIGKKSIVCGNVVSTRLSRAGHLWLNVDKKFPNQIFSIFIRKEDLSNFSYTPQNYLESKDVCFEGKVEDLNGTATINVKREKQVTLLDSKK